MNLEIEGWMTEKELAWLAEQAKTHYIIIEIGSFLGRSTRVLGENTPGVVYAIDDWKGGHDPSIPKRDYYPEFEVNLHDLIAAGKVAPVHADHGAADLDFEPDMVFIDGEHTYEAVVRDIEKWMARMPTGLLCGHDGDYHPVNQAIHQLVLGFQFVEGTTIWFKEL